MWTPTTRQQHNRDRDGAVPLLQASRRSLPFVELAFADSAYGAMRVQPPKSSLLPELLARKERD